MDTTSAGDEWRTSAPQQPLHSESEVRHPQANSSLGLGLSEAGHTVTGFPLIALFQQRNALEALEDVPFRAGGAGGAEAAVL